MSVSRITPVLKFCRYLSPYFCDDFMIVCHMLRIQIREAQKHVDPDPDSDPHHWLKSVLWIRIWICRIHMF